MLRKPWIYLIICFFLVISASCADAGKRVVAVQGSRAKPYNNAYEGFRGVLASDVEIERIILSGMQQGDAADGIRRAGPELVLAIGMSALRQVEKMEKIPVVYVMVLDADKEFSARENITGVSMMVEPEKQLEIIRKALPEAGAIGLIYDPEQTGAMVRQIKAAAAGQERPLVATEVYRPENVPSTLMLMRDKIDVFWMMPDLTVVTPETVRSMFLLALESGMPIISFSEKYVEQGALMSIGVDPYDMGCQAAGIAGKIMAGADADSIPGRHARKAVIEVNTRIAEKLGIVIDEEALAEER
ncbi:MAG: hypothetical protein K9J79_07505 [Desulfobacteraceae bacterium]|nr:hypothetical protein [Desulfobacteraceae bacterium]